MVRGGVPRRVTGDVGRGRPHGGLPGGGRAPDRCTGGGAAGKSSAIGQNVGVDLTSALLHQLLEFGSLVLEPNLHLRQNKRTQINIILWPCENPL